MSTPLPDVIEDWLAPAVPRLLEAAEADLQNQPPSVMDKQGVPPSGDKHDYMSIGHYWWPNPDTADGLPYVRRDGQVNPDTLGASDRAAMDAMGWAAGRLARAYALSGDQRYAQHAALLLRTWFLDPETRMNPHLEYGQGIPGVCQGRGIGLIDTKALLAVPPAVDWLAGSPAWTADQTDALRQWFGTFARWMQESGHGRYEASTHNNHAVFYDVQLVEFADFAGDTETARRVLREVPARRLVTQIEPDGRMPGELARTLGLTYSALNLDGFTRLARAGARLGVDLWGYRSADGRSLRAAVDWLLPYACGEREWPHQQIKPFLPAGFVAVCLRAAHAYGDARYQAAARRLIEAQPELGPAALLERAAPPLAVKYDYKIGS